MLSIVELIESVSNKRAFAASKVGECKRRMEIAKAEYEATVRDLQKSIFDLAVIEETLKTLEEANGSNVGNAGK